MCTHTNVHLPNTEVWTGMHKGMSRDVEFKIIANTHQEVMIHNFLVEAATMTMLDHPNLVQLIGISLDQGISYMITESMEKDSLLEHVRLEGSSMQRSWQIGCVRDVCSGMAYLEQKNLVHRCVCVCVCVSVVVMVISNCNQL